LCGVAFLWRCGRAGRDAWVARRNTGRGVNGDGTNTVSGQSAISADFGPAPVRETLDGVICRALSCASTTLVMGKIMPTANIIKPLSKRIQAHPSATLQIQKNTLPKPLFPTAK
jgi:hypothetical protein